MNELGKLKKIENIRTIWEHERADFSAWLAKEENLSLLGSSINMDIVLDEIESPVGSFSVDILCHEDITNRKIVIENQLEDTNHDHLGKIITYAAGKKADVLIWIVKHARDEHIQAVEWLNEHTDDDIGFFLIEIEVWKINDSVPAVNFKVVERPNDWAKTIKASENLTDTKKLNLAFWQGFSEFGSQKPSFLKEFNIRKSRPQHWYDLAVGSSSYHLSMTINTRDKKVTCGIYIGDDKELFKLFENHKIEIEGIMGAPLEWELLPNKKASRISMSISGDVNKEEDWGKYYSWLCDTSVKFKKAFSEWN